MTIEHDVPAAMRDGVVLRADVYRPATGGPWPVLLTRLPVPELAASATVHYDAWERAIAEFVGRRCGQPANSLYPLAAGRATLAACRAGRPGVGQTM